MPCCPHVASTGMIHSLIEVPLLLRSVPKIFLKTTFSRSALSASIVGRLYAWMNDKRESALKAVSNLANKLSLVLIDIFFQDPFVERCSRRVPLNERYVFSSRSIIPKFTTKCFRDQKN